MASYGTVNVLIIACVYIYMALFTENFSTNNNNNYSGFHILLRNHETQIQCYNIMIITKINLYNNEMILCMRSKVVLAPLTSHARL